MRTQRSFLGSSDCLDPATDYRLLHVGRVEDHDGFTPVEPMRDVRPIASNFSGFPGPLTAVDRMHTTTQSILLVWPPDLRQLVS